MKEEIPKFDLPLDYIVMDDITGELLNQYGRFPCKIKAGLFILCTQGTARATINLSEYVIKENDFVTLLPDSFLQIHEVSADIKLYVAGFSSFFISDFNAVIAFHDFFPVILASPVIALSSCRTPAFANIYKAFIESYQLFPLPPNKEIIKAILLLFTEAVREIYRTHKELSQFPGGREYKVYRAFIQLVMKQYRQAHDVSYYAHKLSLTLPYLSGCVKKASGRTAVDIISATLIMDAKAQLKITDLPVKKIATVLGFENASFFSKFFKRHTGVTPQEYRENG
ncbi:AraC family transcriptional regulator [Parabacteroides pacaensis]|uniref:AraC family transcriptional regulator n=1 Tax=Parabacteroides pacaensis TaxID=2086575 RepID=UPI000D1003A2|nr:helix-turn-helix domain-containing protein [Parabacteroides pacaensis]